ncbi:MAG: peptidase, partial [Deltaproteobacteria bacterium]|nr:peptidase [Deltaproteobacteria bacterium]
MVAEEALAKKLARFVPTTIKADLSVLSGAEKEALKILVKAAEKMDLLFWKQVSEEGLKMLDQVKALKGGYAEKLKKYLLINYGVWDRLDGHEPFIGDKKKPEGANYYPADMTKEEFEKHIKENPGDKDAFQSNFTVIRRGGDGKIKAVPYSEEYGEVLKEAAELLNKAAGLSKNESLKKYLIARADAFLRNDYFESDMAWMDVSESAIEVTVGPYEVYEDSLFNYKAAFEAFITVVDKKETEKLHMIEGLLDELEKNLPIADEHKNFARGKSSPLRVVNLVFSSGDTRAGVQTVAFNLPNDERVREAKGSKKVLLKNVGEAKFKRSLIPIAKEVVDKSLFKYITFNAYFNDVLMG